MRQLTEHLEKALYKMGTCGIAKPGRRAWHLRPARRPGQFILLRQVMGID